jgi:urea carboxylase
VSDQGRDLVAGDVLELSAEAKPVTETPTVSMPEHAIPVYADSWQLAALPGPQADADYLTPDDLASLFSTTYTASLQSDRTGIRLEGLKPLTFSRESGGDGGGHPSNSCDHGYSVGALNLNGDTPGSSRPLKHGLLPETVADLLAPKRLVLCPVDGPDLGGFVCVLAVVTTDHWKLGQIQPGDTFRFVEVDLASVAESRNAQDAWLSRIAHLIGRPDAAESVTDPFGAPVPTASPSDGILARIPADAEQGQPEISFRLSSDAGILAEVGEQALSFRTRAFTQLWENRLRERDIPGLQSFGPGTASLLLRFDPTKIDAQAIVQEMLATSAGLAQACLDSTVPSRRIHLPVVFDDAGSKECIERYSRLTGRDEAVYLPSNVDYLSKINSFDSTQALYDGFLATDWFVSARAFFCGLPFLCPVSLPAIGAESLRIALRLKTCAWPFSPSDRPEIAPRVAKVSCRSTPWCWPLRLTDVARPDRYNPSRTFTPAGTLGYAGCSAAICTTLQSLFLRHPCRC